MRWRATSRNWARTRRSSSEEGKEEHRLLVPAGSSGGGRQTIEALRRRNVVTQRIPGRCVEGHSVRTAMVFNPGIELAQATEEPK